MLRFEVRIILIVRPSWTICLLRVYPISFIIVKTLSIFNRTFCSKLIDSKSHTFMIIMIVIVCRSCLTDIRLNGSSERTAFAFSFDYLMLSIFLFTFLVNYGTICIRLGSLPRLVLPCRRSSCMAKLRLSIIWI